MTDQDDITQAKLSFIREARRYQQLFQNVAWTATADQTDADHVAWLTKTLASTRENVDLPETTMLNAVTDSETGLVLALTGNTPDAADRARFLAGLLQALPHILDEFERLLEADASVSPEKTFV
jgi:hypothetical protein